MLRVSEVVILDSPLDECVTYHMVALDQQRKLERLGERKVRMRTETERNREVNGLLT